MKIDNDQYFRTARIALKTDLGLMKSQLLKTPGAYPNCFGANPDCFLQNYGKNQRKPGFRW